MVKGARVVKLGFSILVLMAGHVWPQEDVPTGNRPDAETAGYSEFHALNERIKVSLGENQALESEYAKLKAEFLDLRDMADSHKKEIAAFDEKSKPPKVATRNPQLLRSILRSNLKQAESADNSTQTGGSAKQEADTDIESPPDIGQIKDLRHLQLCDLYYQKKDLELELQAKERPSRPAQEPQNAQTTALRKEIDRNLEKEKELTRQADEIRHKMVAHFIEIEQLKRENAEIEDQVKSLQRRGSRRGEKAAQGVTDSPGRKKLREETARIGEENQRLRAEILTLRQRLESLGK
jgi:predicted  nucleic acid-binding Zn-ribbon protein